VGPLLRTRLAVGSGIIAVIVTAWRSLQWTGRRSMTPVEEWEYQEDWRKRREPRGRVDSALQWSGGSKR
jgi:hypothetical protein